jgi:hypothetical protein
MFMGKAHAMFVGEAYFAGSSGRKLWVTNK